MARWPMVNYGKLQSIHFKFLVGKEGSHPGNFKKKIEELRNFMLF